MSGQRRRRPDDPARRGWCPSLARPMPTGDGLLARVHPPLGVLSATQVRAIAEAARRYGNGHVDVTARGNLQVRGVSAATAAALAASLSQAGLADVRADGGPQRLTLTSALAGFDAEERIDVAALAQAIEAVGLTVPGLPAKTLVAIDGRGRWGLGQAEADVFVAATGPGRVAIGLAYEMGTLWSYDIAVEDVPAALGRSLNAFAVTGRRRVRDLDAAERAQVIAALTEPARASPSPHPGRGWPPHQHGSGEGSAPYDPVARLSRRGGREIARLAETVRSPPQPGLVPLSDGTAVVIEAPFGRTDANGLDKLAQIAVVARTDVRTSPSRGFALAFEKGDAAADAITNLAAAGFITDAADPRRAVAACPGAPACASGTTPVPDHAAEFAKAFAPFAARGLAAHVSGCAKGCAHPREADLTLVAEDGFYRAIVDGASGDAGEGEHLTFEAALDRVRKADPARPLAGLFRS